jgi:hypothetical protein
VTVGLAPPRTPGTAREDPAGVRRGPRRTVLGLAGLVLALTGILVAEAVTAGHGLTGFRQGTALILTLWVIAAVGLVVAWHQPANPIGWLLAAAPLCLLMTLASDEYVHHYRPGHHALPVLGPVTLIFAQLFFLPFVVFPLVIWLFPDGRLPPGRGKWALWIYLALIVPALVSVVGVTLAAIAGHHIHVLSDREIAQVAHPSPALAAVTLAFFGGLLAGWLGALARQVIAWHRSSGERRQQLKWLMSGSAVCGIFIIASFASSASPWEILMIGAAALPVSIGVGILKYRLYAIDRLISRTLAYALVTSLLVGVYAGLVLLATQVLGFGSAWAVAASTLAAAALFTPLRRRVQRAVDRRFNRAGYDADRMVDAFASRLQDAVGLDTVRTDLAAVVHGALEPAHVTLRMNGGAT